MNMNGHADESQTKEYGEEDDDDDDDDFECDIERYVSFADKLKLAESLKTCSNKSRTDIINLLTEIQPAAIDDYGNSRLQLKIDMIERDAYLKCTQILLDNDEVEPPLKRQKTESSPV